MDGYRSHSVPYTKKAALTYDIRRLDINFILQAAFLRRNYPVQVQRVPAEQIQQQSDLSSDELPQGLVRSGTVLQWSINVNRYCRMASRYYRYTEVTEEITLD